MISLSVEGDAFLNGLFGTRGSDLRVTKIK